MANGLKTARKKETSQSSSAKVPSTSATQTGIQQLQNTVGNQAILKAIKSEAAAVTDALPIDRAKLEIKVGLRLLSAMGAFIDAANEVAAAKKAEAKSKADLANAAIDVLVGWVIPGLAGKIQSLVQSSAKVVGVASAISGSAFGVEVALAAKKVTDNPKTLESLLKQLAKAGTKAISSKAQALFGETSTDLFLVNLKQYFRSFVQSVVDLLPSLSDSEVAALYFTYDADVATNALYRTQLEILTDQFEREVVAIDTAGFFSGPRRDQNVALINDKGEKRYAIVYKQEATIGYAKSGAQRFAPGYHFVSFISPTFLAMALERSREIFGGPLNLTNELIYDLP